jgi:hypothetical protein
VRKTGAVIRLLPSRKMTVRHRHMTPGKLWWWSTTCDQKSVDVVKGTHFGHCLDDGGRLGRLLVLFMVAGAAGGGLSPLLFGNFGVETCDCRCCTIRFSSLLWKAVVYYPERSQTVWVAVSERKSSTLVGLVSTGKSLSGNGRVGRQQVRPIRKAAIPIIRDGGSETLLAKRSVSKKADWTGAANERDDDI